MFKLLLDARLLDSAGIGTYLQNLIPFLKEQVELILLGNKEKIEKFTDLKDLNIIPMKTSIYFPTEQIEFVLKIKNVDVFWSPHFNVPILPIRAKKRLVTIHDVFHLAFKDLYNPFERSYAKFLITSAVKLSDVIITVSNFSKSEIIKYTKVKEEKIKVIYNGIDTRRFRIYRKDELKVVKKKYNLPDKFLLFVGNVKPHKNLKGILRAFRIIVKDMEDLFLVIVGKKEGLIKGDKEIFKIIEKDKILKDKIIFTGFVNKDELPLIYNLANLFVFPSFYEGFGLPPLEAMSCGCPTVVSKIPPLLEVCGSASYYVDPYNAENIAEGIKRVLKDEKVKENLIKRGFERVKNFSWEKSAMEHLEVIKEII